MATVQKWGNSLAIRIPAGLAGQIELTDGTEVDLALREGALVIRPTAEPKLSLRALLASCKPSQNHREVDWGDDVGAEVSAE